MNILKIIKELYTGKNNLVAQLGLFGLIGIMAISFNEIVSTFTGNTLYAIFSVPSEIEIIIFSLLGIMISIYFTGYIYQFAHESFKSDQTQLPSISMNCFTTFIKIIPITLVWSIYSIIILHAGQILFSFNKIVFCVFLMLMIILIPFINSVILMFVKDFKYEKKLFNPLIIINIMKKTFISLFVFFIQFIITGIIIALLSGIFFHFCINSQSRNLQLLYSLLTLCICSYIQQVLNLAYYKGATDIIKKYYG